MVSDTLIGMGIVALGSFIGSYGMVLFKKASSDITNILKLLKNLNFYVGAFLNFLGVLILVYALRFGDLSSLYPVVSLSYVWVAIFSVTILKEKINGYKWAGILLIMLGVVFIGLGA